MADLISINEAAELGVERVRRPIWANPLDHLKLDLLPDGKRGPWTHLFSPFNKECNGRDSVSILSLGDSDRQFVPYTGPLPDSAEYQAEAARFAGCLAEPAPGEGGGVMEPRLLVGKIGDLRVGNVFRTDKMDGGPFLLVVEAKDYKSGVEGVSFAMAARLSDGRVVSLDATHFAWTRSRRKAAP